MKKIWYYPIIGSFAVLVWYIVCLFMPDKSDYAALWYLFWGAALIAVLFPMLFAWYASKHTKLVIIPALYTTIVFILPWLGMILRALSSTSGKETVISVVLTIFLWNLAWFAGMRICRVVIGRKRKAAEAKKLAQSNKEEEQNSKEDGTEENKAE